MQPIQEALHNAKDEEKKRLEFVAEMIALARSLEERVGDLEDARGK